MIKENNISLREYKKEFEIYEKSITIQCIVDKETAEGLKFNIGDKYTTKLIPQSREEALERLTNYDAMQLFFAFVKDFNDKYSLNIKTLKDELDTLNQFIEEADKIKMEEAIDIYNINHNPSKKFEYEYIKLKNGHYENKKFYNYFSFFDNLTRIVKAKYFLYKECLENEVKNIEEIQSPFIGVFYDKNMINLFNQYTKLHMIDKYVDYSYLFQRLKEDKLIIKKPHLYFAELLHKNGYINEKDMDLINKNSGFRSLKKSFSAQRDNNFNNIFKR